MNLKIKNFLAITDLNKEELLFVLKTAKDFKTGKLKEKTLSGKSVAMIFEKPSTRTSVSFTVAMYELGGFPLMLDARNMQSRRGESIHDTATVLSRYLDGVMFRALKHDDAEAFAHAATVPVINGLTNKEHPCQILGDILTIIEKRSINSAAGLRKIKVAFVGDGNNVANSWIGAAAVLGFHIALARPAGYGPDETLLKKAHISARRTGGKITITSNVAEAVKDADVIYTDVWTSMGAEDEQKERRRVFRPYQVNASMLKKARPNCMVMHCLPAIREEEITSEIMDGKHSVIFDEAENRLHIQKALLVFFMK